MANKEENAKNKGIDYRSIRENMMTNKPFPVGFCDEYRVYFEKRAYDDMMEHASRDNEVEHGGVLIGDVCKDSAGPFLNIVGSIPGEHGTNAGAQMTFTHETWRHINKVKDKDYPDNRIVGWYHTHPGFGVFLSEMDSFIQENFFNMPYQVAVVIETREKSEGCFAWSSGKIVPLDRYWVGDRVVPLAGGTVKKIAKDSDKPDSEKERVPPAGDDSQERTCWDSLLMSLLALAVALFVGYLLGRLVMFDRFQKEVLSSLQSEIYSILEHAAVNTSAGMDIDKIGAEIESIRENAKAKPDPDADTVARLEKLRVETAMMKQNYAVKRSQFREALMEMQNKKATLSRKVKEVATAEDELKGCMLTLYILRIKEILGDRDYMAASNTEQAMVRNYLGLAIMLEPSSKYFISKAIPGLIEQVFPKGIPMDFGRRQMEQYNEMSPFKNTK